MMSEGLSRIGNRQMFNRQGRAFMKRGWWCCIMGNVGSNVFGTTKLTKLKQRAILSRWATNLSEKCLFFNSFLPFHLRLVLCSVPSLAPRFIVQNFLTQNKTSDGWNCSCWMVQRDWAQLSPGPHSLFSFFSSPFFPLSHAFGCRVSTINRSFSSL